MTRPYTRRDFSRRLAALAVLGGGARVAIAAQGSSPDEIARNAERIHQEVAVDAPPARVYRALTTPAEFSAMMAFSSVPNAAPAKIATEVGGAFSLFDGHILGRHLELVAGRRIVQGWRVATWDPGVFSIARFELRERSAGTLVVFDHTGFPQGEAEHLAQGWHANYWQPLKKHLGVHGPETGAGTCFSGPAD